MYEVIVFAGTVEGRTVAEYLNEHRIPARICVATEYGESLMPKGEYLQITHDRMEADEMEKMMLGMKDGLVIDATHPYAEAVTENIQSACEKTATAYMRIVRQETQIAEESSIPMVYVKSIREAVAYLEQTKGRILVTTGSKELASYTALKDYAHRIYARVLSLSEVVQSCAALGIEGQHLICMQGPFSREMNAALIRQFDISWMVSKESGRAGGFMEKYLAAKETGCGMVIIGRPKKEEGYTLEACFEYLNNRLAGGGFRAEEMEASGGAPGAAQSPLQISLVGIGMGTRDTLTAEAARAIDGAQLLIGAARMLEHIRKPYHDTYCAYRADEICQWIAGHPKYRRVAVALSGDLGFFSGAKKLSAALARELPGAKVRLYCGISSMAYFAARLQIAWEDALPVSLHGRDRNVAGLLRKHEKIFCLIGSADGIQKLCRKLTDAGLGHTRLAIGERLSYPDEKITEGIAENLVNRLNDPLCVAFLFRAEGETPVHVPGIPDGAFIRTKIPMTKEEVRSVSLAKLRLEDDSVVWDIGAGTGSVSVEAALWAVDGKVFAVERNPEAADLILDNIARFGVENVEIVKNEAPDGLEDLPAPTHVFIGGSHGRLRGIVEAALLKNPRARFVVNAITLETVAETLRIAQELPVGEADIVQITAARGKTAGPYHLMMGQNPVTVISFDGLPAQEGERNE